MPLDKPEAQAKKRRKVVKAANVRADEAPKAGKGGKPDLVNGGDGGGTGVLPGVVAGTEGLLGKSKATPRKKAGGAGGSLVEPAAKQRKLGEGEPKRVKKVRSMLRKIAEGGPKMARKISAKPRKVVEGEPKMAKKM